MAATRQSGCQSAACGHVWLAPDLPMKIAVFWSPCWRSSCEQYEHTPLSCWCSSVAGVVSWRAGSSVMAGVAPWLCRTAFSGGIAAWCGCSAVAGVISWFWVCRLLIWWHLFVQRSLNFFWFSSCSRGGGRGRWGFAMIALLSWKSFSSLP